MTTNNKEITKHYCKLCNSEINTPRKEMVVDMNKDGEIRGTLCIDCFRHVRILEYLISGKDLVLMNKGQYKYKDKVGSWDDVRK
jgi:hypothetical protein